MEWNNDPQWYRIPATAEDLNTPFDQLNKPNFLFTQASHLGPYEWLVYLGTDNRSWKTKCHAKYTDGNSPLAIKCWFQSELENGGGDNSTMQIYGPNSQKWNVKIQDIGNLPGSNLKEVSFELTPA